MEKKGRRITACIIPARYASQRLPAKALIAVRGMPIIVWVYKNVVRSQAFDSVIVATDDRRIADAVRRWGGTAVMTSVRHTSGTDRIYEAAHQIRCDYIVNVQGDEPRIPPRMLREFKKALRGIDDNTLLTCATNATLEEMHNPSVVKVVRNAMGEALYFSRSPIPYYRSGASGKRLKHKGLKHIGIYGFTFKGLGRFCALPKGWLEQAEKLEQLRALEGGMKIRCLVLPYRGGIAVDTPADLAAFRLMAGETTGEKKGQRP